MTRAGLWRTTRLAAGLLACWQLSLPAPAQGLTTASLLGTVTDAGGHPLSGAVVTAEHAPSGTAYTTLTTREGRFYLPDLRVGGPYRVGARYPGLPDARQDSISLSLGEQLAVRLVLKNPLIALGEVTVSAGAEPADQAERTGAALLIDQGTIAQLPNASRSLEDVLRLVPQANGAGFAGKSPRANYFTIDGAVFNNAYGLANSVLAGTSTGAQPLSLEALDQVRVNLAPYDVRQSGFTAASINLVTKKGDNQWRGTAYYYLQSAALVGQKMSNTASPTGTFHQHLGGFTIGGPVVKNRLFVFFNAERVWKNEAATLFQAARPTAPGPNVTRVLATDLDELRQFLRQQYGYETGAYENYPLSTRNLKLTLNLDYNISDRHKLGIRYVYLDARQEKTLDNGNFVGAGGRNQNLYALSYQHSDLTRFTKVQSAVAELTTKLGASVSNRLLASFSYFPDRREPRGPAWPLVDILKEGRTYLSFGTDPFAYGNSLRSNSWQLQDQVGWQTARHYLTVGMSTELLGFQNTFVPGYLGAFTYGSLADFYQSTPAGTPTPVGPSSGTGRALVYQRTYVLPPANTLPAIEPRFGQAGLYVQDEYTLSKALRLTLGLRAEQAFFGGQTQDNPAVAQGTFRTRAGLPRKLRTGLLPRAQTLWSPRLGFQWQPCAGSAARLRGGTGIFSGRIPFVFLGEQLRQNGLQTLSFQTLATAPYPFDPSPDAYPLAALGSAPGSAPGYDIVVLEPDFRLPQLWRSNLGLDYRFGAGLVATVDALYSRDLYVTGVYNASLGAEAAVAPADGRFRLLNTNVSAPVVRNAYVVDNDNWGRQISLTAQLSRDWGTRARVSLSYTYGNAKELGSFPGTEPASAFLNAATAGHPNQPVLAFSDFDQPHRAVGFASYAWQLTPRARTVCVLLLDANQRGRFSYTYAGRGDLNGDGIGSNDLLFVPARPDQINLVAYPDEHGQLVTAAAQWQALNDFIARSAYLTSRRGDFAERNGAILPWTVQADFKLTQEFTSRGRKRAHTLALSADLLNLPNLLYSGWGTRPVPATTQPIEATSATTFRVNPTRLDDVFIAQPGLASRWQLQLGMRYTW